MTGLRPVLTSPCPPSQAGSSKSRQQRCAIPPSAAKGGAQEGWAGRAHIYEDFAKFEKKAELAYQTVLTRTEEAKVSSRISSFNFH
jgi:predicted secreted protein